MPMHRAESGLLVPTRRGFLSGLIGLVAAPAIIKIDNLMKLSSTAEPMAKYPPGTFITIEMIDREIQRIMKISGVDKIAEVNVANQRMNSAYYLSAMNRTNMEFKEYAERLIHPAVGRLDSHSKALKGRAFVVTDMDGISLIVKKKELTNNA